MPDQRRYFARIRCAALAFSPVSQHALPKPRRVDRTGHSSVNFVAEHLNPADSAGTTSPALKAEGRAKRTVLNAPNRERDGFPRDGDPADPETTAPERRKHGGPRR